MSPGQALAVAPEQEWMPAERARARTDEAKRAAMARKLESIIAGALDAADREQEKIVWPWAGFTTLEIAESVAVELMELGFACRVRAYRPWPFRRAAAQIWDLEVSW